MDREAHGLQVPLNSNGTCETERLSIHAARSAAHRLADVDVPIVRPCLCSLWTLREIASEFSPSSASVSSASSAFPPHRPRAAPTLLDSASHPIIWTYCRFGPT